MNIVISEGAVARRTATTGETKKLVPLWVPILLAVALIAGLAYWLGGRTSAADTPVVSPREMVQQATEQGGIEAARELLRGGTDSGVTETRPQAKGGSWEKKVRTSKGLVLVKYDETRSAKGKAQVELTNDDQRIMVTNKAREYISFTLFEKWLDAKGKIINENERTYALGPGHYWDDGLSTVDGTVIHELWVEVE